MARLSLVPQVSRHCRLLSAVGPVSQLVRAELNITPVLAGLSCSESSPMVLTVLVKMWGKGFPV